MTEERQQLMRELMSPEPNVMVQCPDCTDIRFRTDDTLGRISCPTCHNTGKVPSAEEATMNELSAANKRVQEAWNAYRDALRERNKIEEQNGTYRCSVCLEAFVEPSKGFDTCPKCSLT